MFSQSLFLGLFAVPAALAAGCYPSPNPGFSIEEFQETAAQVCNYGSATLTFGNTGSPNYYTRQITATYNGTEKLHCWDAFNNIIGQCVQGSGLDGGDWRYDYNSDHENYTIQAVLR